MEFILLILLILVFASEYFGTSNVGRPGEDEVKPTLTANNLTDQTAAQGMLEMELTKPEYRRLVASDDVTPDMGI